MVSHATARFHRVVQIKKCEPRITLITRNEDQQSTVHLKKNGVPIARNTIRIIF